jgi:hypothetical protein
MTLHRRRNEMGNWLRLNKLRRNLGFVDPYWLALFCEDE